MPPSTLSPILEAVEECLATERSIAISIEMPGHVEGPVAISATFMCVGDSPGAALVMVPTARPPRGEDDQTFTIRLIAEVAHELSRPISAILNYTEMALFDPELSAAARARLQMILEQAGLCQRAVRHLLAEGTFSQPFLADIDINDITHRAVRSAEAATAASEVELTLYLATQLPPIAGDPEDLTAVIRNLLENAIQAANGDSPAVALTTEATPAGVRITVTDNGPGIAPEVTSTLFDPFITTKAVGEGTGLGLSIVRRIVNQHDGQVRADSSPDGGARFTVDLPTSDPTSLRPAETLVDDHQPEPASETAETCLVVDDDKSMRGLLREYLGSMGYDVSEARDGAEALRMALAEKYDLIVCDIKMPMMNGADFFRALNEKHPDRAARVVFSTGILPTDKSDAFLRGLPNPRLQKPFRLSALRAAIETVNVTVTGG
ncbi:MAG TPA: hybrid sensor histidine kinase/response regulator [Armatimonadota bacterium]|nr:hybrid sensor histidine kinase/response regulator [Armatimonadota bacterium]